MEPLIDGSSMMELPANGPTPTCGSELCLLLGRIESIALKFGVVFSYLIFYYYDYILFLLLRAADY